MRITRLEAKSIGPFEDLNIEFKPKPTGMEKKAEIHILTGENGTGKSTILMALASCGKLKEMDSSFIIERTRLKKVIPRQSSIQISFDDPVRISLSPEPLFTFQDKNWFAIDYLDTYWKRPNELDYTRFTENFKMPESLKSNIVDYPNHKFNANEGKNEMMFAYFAYSGYRISKATGLVNIKEITSNPLENAVNFEKSINYDFILDWVANVITKGLLSKSRGKEITENNAVQKIEKALSDITGKKIEFDLEESLKVSVKINDENLSFNILPDGLKSIIFWLSDLLMRLDRINWADKTLSILDQNFILFLDEIEVHLHPSWQRKILPVVQDLFPNAQIFISTHSPFVVGSVDNARVYKFKLENNTNNSVLANEYWSQDGQSYDRILEEIFDIKERFGVGVQEKLELFYDFKNKIIRGQSVDNQAFMSLVHDLENQGLEVQSIIGFEMRQIERINKQILETA